MLGDTIIYEPDNDKIKHYPEEEHGLKFTEIYLNVIAGIDWIDLVDAPIDISENVSYDEDAAYTLDKLNPEALRHIFDKHPILNTLEKVEDLDEDEDLYQLGEIEIGDLLKLYAFTQKYGMEDIYAYAAF